MTDFGKETFCLDSRRTGAYVTGARLVGQATYRRLITQRGALRGGVDEASYGLDLTQMIGQMGGASAAKVWERRIRAEVLKDPRLIEADVSVVQASDGAADSWTVTVQGYTAEGPFDLVLAVESVTVALVGLEAS